MFMIELEIEELFKKYSISLDTLPKSKPVYVWTDPIYEDRRAMFFNGKTLEKHNSVMAYGKILLELLGGGEYLKVKRLKEVAEAIGLNIDLPEEKEEISYEDFRGTPEHIKFWESFGQYMSIELWKQP